MTAHHPTRRVEANFRKVPGGHVIRPDLTRQDIDGIIDRLRKA
ncbi:hypothetical protein ACIG5E_20030 [Kitasatospora sp. NPDC053057]